MWYSHDELMNAAMDWAKQICACAPLSIRASKDVVVQEPRQRVAAGRHGRQVRFSESHDQQRRLHRGSQGICRSVHPIGGANSPRPDLAEARKEG